LYSGTVAHENIDDISGSVSYTCTLYISKLLVICGVKHQHFCITVPSPGSVDMFLPFLILHTIDQRITPLSLSQQVSAFFSVAYAGGASQEAFVDHAYCTHQALSQRCAEALQWGNRGRPLDRTQQSVVESARLWFVTLSTLDRDVLPELSFCTVGLHNSA
jgi:hypothetical protein